jgi:hypothetical protein
MAKQSYYNKLIKKLEKVIYEEEGFSENFEDLLNGALSELQKRKYYLPVIPGQEFWYVTESLFGVPPIIEKVKCKDIGWNKAHKQVTIILEDGSEVYSVEFEKNAFTYEGSAQRYYNKLMKEWKLNNKDD